MAAEAPNIKSVLNNVAQVSLPNMEDARVTYMTTAVAAAGTTLAVRSNVGFSDDDYLVLGDIGGQQTEIVRIDGAITPGTALTISACVFSHGVGTKITQIKYNQVALYGAATADEAAPTLIGGAVGLDVKNGFNEITATTTYNYYYARYYNEVAAVYSVYSDSVAASGLGVQSRGEIKKEFLSVYNERYDDLITADWLDRSINRWQRELTKRKKQWSWLKSSYVFDTVQDQQKYSLPSDIIDSISSDGVMSVKYKDGKELQFLDQRAFLAVTATYIGSTLAADVALVDVTVTISDSSDFASSGSINVQGDTISYTANAEATGILSGVTGITAIHSSGDEVWQTYTTGDPRYYTIDSGYIKIDPIPNSVSAASNIYIEYWSKMSDLTNDADATLCPYPENCLLYLDWQLALRRKLPIQDREGKHLIWADDVDTMALEDPDVRDINITPPMYYYNPY